MQPIEFFAFVHEVIIDYSLFYEARINLEGLKITDERPSKILLTVSFCIGIISEP